MKDVYIILGVVFVIMGVVGILLDRSWSEVGTCFVLNQTSFILAKLENLSP